MILETAKRIRHTTELKWLRLDKSNNILNVIFEDGIEKELHNIDELLKLYTPTADKSMFAHYHIKNNNKVKEPPMSKKQSQEKPSDVKRPPAPKHQTPSPKKTNDFGLPEVKEYLNMPDVKPPTPESPNITFSNDLEVLYILQMFTRKGLEFEMDFEDVNDLYYRKNKLAEKYPKNSFRMKTLRSVVSYVEL